MKINVPNWQHLSSWDARCVIITAYTWFVYKQFFWVCVLCWKDVYKRQAPYKTRWHLTCQHSQKVSNGVNWCPLGSKCLNMFLKIYAQIFLDNSEHHMSITVFFDRNLPHVILLIYNKILYIKRLCHSILHVRYSWSLHLSLIHI